MPCRCVIPCAAAALLLSVLLFPRSSLPAQNEPPPAVFRSGTRLVILNVSVFDRAGNIVKGLSRSAFTVYEDGVKQDIKVFRQEDVPVSLGLVIDNSASMGDKRARVAGASLALVKASNPQDEIFVVNFSDVAVVAQGFTNSIPLLEQSLGKLDSRGETAMRDALRLGIESLRLKARKDKKVLLVVTDGEDNSSVVTQPALVQAAQRNDVIVYGVGLLGAEAPESASRARKSLEELTLATGGRSWFPAGTAEIGRIAPEIAHEIRNQYVAGYTPSNESTGGTFRKVQVEVAAPGATVRTRSGYYAPER